MDWTIDDWEWTRSRDGADAVDRAPIDPSPSDIARLRKKLSAQQVRVAIELARARDKASRKLDQQIVGDCAGVEMASSTAAARYKASRFVRTLGEGASIVDLCCGIGGDAIELKNAGLDVVAVDHDPVRSWMCAQNAGIRSLACDVLDPAVPSGAFHLDPARRTQHGQRSRELDDLRPGPSAWEELIRSRSDGAIKLHPGARASELPDGELEIISESGKLTQSVLWIGRLSEHERRATLLDESGNVAAQLVGAAERPEDESPIGAFIHTMDPSVERADLVPELINETGLSLVYPGTGLLTGAQALAHPMTNAFRVLDTLAWNPKRVKSILRSHGAGPVEVKARAKAVDTDATQQLLRGEGDRMLTVFVLPIAGSIRAIVAERAEQNTRSAAAPSGHSWDSNP
jgi:hypothetical protein